jgi:hypothetical protein
MGLFLLNLDGQLIIKMLSMGFKWCVADIVAKL